MVDHCYYLIGFPMGHKWHGKNMKPRNKRSAVHNVEVKRESSNECLTFTAKEYKQILPLIRNKNGNDQPLTYVTCIFTLNYKDMKHNAHSMLYQIADSGATKHISHFSHTHSKNKAPHDFVGLPNQERARIENIGFV